MCSFFHIQLDIHQSTNQMFACCFIFLSNMCFIRDLSCWKMIGVGTLHRNLYLLQTSVSCKSILAVSSILGYVLSSFVNNVVDVLVTTKSYIQHLRLSHVSDAKLQTLSDCLPDVSTVHSNKDCALCPLQKRKDYLFLLSIICLVMLLILFIVMFGDQLPNVLMMVLCIFLQLLMMQLDQHGSIL